MVHNKKQVLFSIIFLFCLSLLLMLRIILSKGYISFAADDTFAYVSWTWQFIDALKQGVIYPRWASLTFWEYGSPTFVLYPPLAFYLTALVNVFIDPIIGAMNITKFISFFLSSIGIFYLLREFYPFKIALFSASFYILLPHSVYTCYGTFASIISFMWFSPILLFAYRHIANGKYKYLLCSGVCYGGLIITHLINAYMFSFVMIGFGIFMSIIKKEIKNIISILLMMTIGVLISSAYIIPLIYEKQFVNLNAFIGGGFEFTEYFILPNLSNKSQDTHFWNVLYLEYVFHASMFCILIILSLLNTLKMSRISEVKNIMIFNIFMIIVASFSLFLLFGVSKFLWKIIPYFSFIQFPIRWMNITAFALACLSANWLYTIKIIIMRGGIYSYTTILFLIICVCIFFDYRYIHNANVFKEEDLIPVKTVNWTMEHLPKNVIIEKIDKENGLDNRLIIHIGNGKTEIVKWGSHRRVIKIGAISSLTLEVKSFNFPGWKALLNGMETKINTGEGSGAILIDIPKGNNILELTFVDTPIRYFSKSISIISFGLVFFLLLIPRKEIENKKGVK